MGEGPPVAALSGLSEEEAGARLAAEGPNELPRPSRHGVLALAGEVVREPMILLLLFIGVLYSVLGVPACARPPGLLGGGPGPAPTTR